MGEFLQLAARQHAVRPGRQGLQQVKFHSGKINRRARTINKTTSVEIERQCPELQTPAFLNGCLRRHCLTIGRRCLDPAQHALDASKQFAQFIRFHKIVIRADLQTDDAINRSAGRRRHDDPGLACLADEARE